MKEPLSARAPVEAGARSGSLDIATRAHTLGRPVGAVPGPVTSAASAGCHRLLREQIAVVITDADEVRRLLQTGRPAPELTLDRTPHSSIRRRAAGLTL